MVYMLAGCLSEENVRALFFAGLHLINAGCCTEIVTAAGGKQLHIQVGTDSRRAHLVSLEHGCLPKCVACKVLASHLSIVLSSEHFFCHSTGVCVNTRLQVACIGMT